MMSHREKQKLRHKNHFVSGIIIIITLNY